MAVALKRRAGQGWVNDELFLFTCSGKSDKRDWARFGRFRFAEEGLGQRLRAVTTLGTKDTAHCAVRNAWLMRGRGIRYASSDIEG